MRKAKLLTDSITPDFLYAVVKEENGFVKLGWRGRRGFWNETLFLPVSDVEFFDVAEDCYDAKKI